MPISHIPLHPTVILKENTPFPLPFLWISTATILFQIRNFHCTETKAKPSNSPMFVPTPVVFVVHNA